MFDLRRLMFARRRLEVLPRRFPCHGIECRPDQDRVGVGLAQGRSRRLRLSGDRDRTGATISGPSSAFRLEELWRVDRLENAARCSLGTSFPGDTDRSELIRQMCEEARRSMLFLKSLRRVTFGGLAERRFDEWVTVEAMRQPSDQLERFVTAVHAMRTGSAPAGREQCSFRTDVSVRVSGERISASPGKRVVPSDTRR